MQIEIDQSCNECGETDWEHLLTDTYPDRDRDSDETEKRVFECQSCGAHARRFKDGESGYVRFTGALR